MHSFRCLNYAYSQDTILRLFVILRELIEDRIWQFFSIECPLQFIDDFSLEIWEILFAFF